MGLGEQILEIALDTQKISNDIVEKSGKLDKYSVNVKAINDKL
jgi:hypothetical protein